MPERMLFTLTHVSDLHIAEVDPVSGNGAVSPALIRAAAKLPYIGGLIGHGGAALRDLESLIRSVPAPLGVPRRLLVTGDFTRCGGSNELKLAHDYLGAGIALVTTTATRVSAGLNAPPSRTLSIPGNHDQWGGINQPVSGAQSDYAASDIAKKAVARVGPLPGIECIALPEGHQLTLFQVDSDADVHRLSHTRFLARGAFDSQLNGLRSQLTPSKPAPGELRILVIHHSYGHAGPALAMVQSSKDALYRFVVDYGVPIVLSGHTHVCDVLDITSPATGSVVAREISCGSSAQLDHVPSTWPVRPAGWGGMQVPNSVLVHELLKLDDGRLMWRARPHYRDVVTGFRDIKQWWEIDL